MVTTPIEMTNMTTIVDSVCFNGREQTRGWNENHAVLNVANQEFPRTLLQCVRACVFTDKRQR